MQPIMKKIKERFFKNYELIVGTEKKENYKLEITTNEIKTSYDENQRMNDYFEIGIEIVENTKKEDRENNVHASNNIKKMYF